MKVCKGAVAAVGLMLAGTAFAQDAAVQTEKKAPLQQLLPGAYASIETRHTTGEVVDSETGDSNIKPALSFRPTVGSTFFDGKLDTAFTWIFAKKPDNVALTKSLFYNETTFTVWENDNFKLYPYAYIEQAAGDSFSVVDIGPHFDAKQVFATGAGDLTISGFVEPLAEFTSGKARPRDTVRNGTGRESYSLAPTDNGEEPVTDTPREDPNYYNTTEASVAFAPSAVKGLKAKVVADYLQNWDPKYVARDHNDGTTQAELDGYKVKDSILNKFNVEYKLNDTFTVINSARYMVGGFYSDTYAPSSSEMVTGVPYRFENRFIVNATLF